MVLLSQNSQILFQIEKILEYQFSFQFASTFLENFQEMELTFSKKTGKFKHIYLNDTLQASYRPQLGTFTVTLDAGLRVLSNLEFPKFRIVVQDDVSPYIKAGKSVFSKHIVDYDRNLNVGDEVFVVNPEDNLLAIGRMEIPAVYLKDFQTGSAVSIRKGINASRTKN